MDSLEIRPSILIVDDEETARESLKALLEDKYAIFSAQDGDEALDIVQNETIDLVILDVIMPGMDGIETLKKIKETDDCEVMVVSAVKTVKTAIQALKLGACGYVTKPFDADEILASISNALHKRSMSKQIIYLIDIILHNDKTSIDVCDNLPLRRARGEFEKRFIIQVLQKTKWNQTKAARLMGIHRNALLYKIHSYNLRPVMKRNRTPA